MANFPGALGSLPGIYGPPSPRELSVEQKLIIEKLNLNREDFAYLFMGSGAADCLIYKEALFKTHSLIIDIQGKLLTWDSPEIDVPAIEVTLEEVQAWIKKDERLKNFK